MFLILFVAFDSLVGVWVMFFIDMFGELFVVYYLLAICFCVLFGTNFTNVHKNICCLKTGVLLFVL